MFFTFERHTALRADSRARAKTGNTIAARMPMMAMTTSNSISVKPCCLLIGRILLMWRGHASQQPGTKPWHLVCGLRLLSPPPRSGHREPERRGCHPEGVAGDQAQEEWQRLAMRVQAAIAEQQPFCEP